MRRMTVLRVVRLFPSQKDMVYRGQHDRNVGSKSKWRHVKGAVASGTQLVWKAKTNERPDKAVNNIEYVVYPPFLNFFSSVAIVAAPVNTANRNGPNFLNPINSARKGITCSATAAQKSIQPQTMGKLNP